MDPMRRVLVHVCRDAAAPQRAHFIQSITGHFLDGGDQDQVEVNLSLDQSQLLLSSTAEGQRILLKRPVFCPFKHLSPTEAAAIPLDVVQRGVDVGVAVLLQTANQRVLLTRRSQQLRVFPNVWVPPGGHVEPDETLLDAGLREFKEETGLTVKPEDTSPKILGLWESVFPAMLSRGRPQRHHIVVYMLLHSSLSHLQLQSYLRPSPAEVSACLWADSGLVRSIVSAVDGEDQEVELDAPSEKVSVVQVSADGALSDSQLPLAVILSRAPASGPDVERVSTGTKFALDLWLRTLTSDL